MIRSCTVLLAAALTVGGVAAVATPAGATAHCTAWATLPAQVALTSSGTTIRPQLTGTADCRAGSFDGGATASLRVHGEQPYDQRWAHFGDREQIELHPSLDPVGRYEITAGDVQVYDRNEVRVAATWRTTSTVVKFGARFGAVSSSRTGAKAVLSHYSADGWRRSSGTTVSLQKRTSNGWTTVAHKRTGTRGAVAFTHSARGQYRLVSAGSGSVWAASAALAHRT